MTSSAEPADLDFLDQHTRVGAHGLTIYRHDRIGEASDEFLLLHRSG